MADEFRRALADLTYGYAALQPPLRMSVTSAAAKFMTIARPGGGSRLYDPLETPYMEEPGLTLTDRTLKGTCFVAPAQSGKTVLLGEGWLTYLVKCDPGDMLIVQMTQDKAREYSKQRIDRMIRNSAELSKMKGVSSSDDNLHDKQFRNGMWLKIAWPTASNLASSSYRAAFGTDYDRWPHDIDGEGDGWTQMLARIRTFQSRGHACIESSPGRNVSKPDWHPAAPHEAPPVGGILGVYNTTDRRRLRWQCPHCEEHFEPAPGLGLFRLPSDDELLEDIRSIDIGAFAKQYARIICPHCDGVIQSRHKASMNRGAVWLRAGLEIDRLKRVSGNPIESNVAGFWLGGVAATYQSWPDLISSHLQALHEYEMTGSETKLQSAANTMQSMPYTPRHLVEASRKRSSGDKIRNVLPRFVAPAWARFLIQSVDVQGGSNARFIVQVHAVGEDRQQATIDRYEIREIERDGQMEAIEPGARKEDWDILTTRVISATYKIEGREEELEVHRTMVDSGGEEGVTLNCYAWLRRLRKLGLSQKVYAYKGQGVAAADWTYRLTQVGGLQNKGDIPLYILNSNRLKDDVDALLRRQIPGPGYYYFPGIEGKDPGGWVKQSFYDELSAEIRDEKGRWVQKAKRNETFDLCYTINAGIQILGCDRRGFWQSPPEWALPLDAGNSNVVSSEERREAKKQVAQQVAQESYRRSNPSSYLA